MNTQDQHINELLAKLADGSISDQERYTLQRYSLDDPFVADAMEGYLDAPVGSHENQLASIKDAIKKDQPIKAKTIPLWIKYSPIGLVASFLIVFMIYRSQDDEQNQFTSTSIPEAKAADVDNSSIAYEEAVENDFTIDKNDQDIDSEVKNEAIAEAEVSNKKAEAIKRKKAKSDANVPSKAKPTSTINANYPSENKQIANNEPEITATADRSEAENPPIIAEEADIAIVDNSKLEMIEKFGLNRKVGIEVSNAEDIRIIGFTVKDAESNMVIAQTTVGNNLGFELDNSTKILEISHPGYLPQLVDLSVLSEDTLRVKLLDNAYAVVDQARLGNYMSTSQSGNVGLPTKDISIEPRIGIEKYEVYIAKAIKDNEVLVAEDSLQIVLEFIILEDGQLDRVKVVNTNCEACNLEAIEILKNGPKWQAPYYPYYSSYRIEL